MSFWEWLDRRWPSERAWVTIATFALAASMLKMAEVHRELWNVELFKTLLTLVVGTAIVNMILAYHFTANKADEGRVERHEKTLDTIKAVASAAGGAEAEEAAADRVAEAAVEEAEDIKRG